MPTVQRTPIQPSDSVEPPAAAGDSPVRLLHELQSLAAEAPLRAREDLRTWLSVLGRRNDGETLGLLMTQGTAPDGPQGRTEGEMLGRLGGPLQVRLAGHAQGIGESLGMGWKGKTFDGPSTGYNRLTRRSMLPMQILSLGYRCQPLNGREALAFRFEHRIEASAFVEGLQVRSIRYDGPGHGNPAVLHRTRDELVQLAPGAYLGHALMLTGGRWGRIGFFTAFTDPRKVA
jgi:hypothetical protein